MAQNEGISEIRSGVRADKVHEAVCSVFRESNFDVGDEGFVHGTGHGLGLEVHEDPYINATSGVNLQAGNVVTVEPGLYYEGMGGVRLEDVVLVTMEGAENLTNYDAPFIIP